MFLNVVFCVEDNILLMDQPITKFLKNLPLMLLINLLTNGHLISARKNLQTELKVENKRLPIEPVCNVNFSNCLQTDGKNVEYFQPQVVVLYRSKLLAFYITAVH